MQRNITILLTLLFSTITYTLYAQVDTLNWHSGIKLRYSHFKIDPSSQPYLSININYEYELQPSIYGKSHAIVDAKAVLTTSASTLADSTTKSLEYAQFQFDLAGYQTKLIKYKTFELGILTGSPAEKRKKMNDIFFLANQEISKLNNELFKSLSQDQSEFNFAKWRNRIGDLLASVPEVHIEERELGFRLGLYLGLGHHFLTGTTTKYFTNPTSLNWGFNVDVKKSRFELDMQLGANKTKLPLTAKGNWPSGTKTSFANIEITYGRKFRRDKWLLVPYAGLGINELSARKADSDDKRRLSGYSPVLGFELNYYFGSQEDHVERVLFFYRCKVSVNPSNFMQNYNGTQFNVKLAIGFDVARSKNRMAVNR